MSKIPLNLPTIADLGGKTKKIRRLVDKSDLDWSTFNPSIAYSVKDGYICILRSANYFYNDLGHTQLTVENVVRNKMYLARLNSDFEVTKLIQIFCIDGPKQKRGSEDARLYQRNGDWYFHAVMREEHSPNPRIISCRLDINSGTANFIKKYDFEGYQPIEKNWMLPSTKENPNFEFIYNLNAVVKTDNPLVLNRFQKPKLSEVRGGTGLFELEDGSYIAACHILYYEKRQGFSQTRFAYHQGVMRLYTHVFVKFNNLGEPTHMSDEFYFDRPQLEFAAGITDYQNQFVISYGVKDLSANLAFIDKETVYKMLKPI